MPDEPQVRVHNLSVSLDGYAAGPDQSQEWPLGVGGESLHEWMFATPYWKELVGDTVPADADRTTIDNRMMERSFANVGAHVLGRNMFGPVRGPWPDDQWRGWWGPNPPYHHDVYVLTHHARDPIPMEGGTTFHFVTDGIESALDRAKEAAAGQDVRIGGGASTVRQYLRAGLIDELQIAVVPLLLGSGERLFTSDDDLASLPHREVATAGAVAHLTFTRG